MKILKNKEGQVKYLGMDYDPITSTQLATFEYEYDKKRWDLVLYIIGNNGGYHWDWDRAPTDSEKIKHPKKELLLQLLRLVTPDDVQLLVKGLLVAENDIMYTRFILNEILEAQAQSFS